MIDAVMGAVFIVMASAALALLAEVSDLAISPSVRPLTEYEQKVLASAAKGQTLSQVEAEAEKLAQWMAALRKVPATAGQQD